MDSPARVDFLAPDGPFEQAALRSYAVASCWRPLLTAADRVPLVAGFYLAETLAGYAISHARQQVPAEYHAGLDVQAADEARHIEVFASWMPFGIAVPEPRVRQRQTIQWLVLLLVNELTGFCQFRMLARLMESDDARHAVDERVHVARLMGWLEPLRSDRSARPVVQFIERFRRDLPGRMCQFFPRVDLHPLRDEMAGVIDDLLGALPFVRG